VASQLFLHVERELKRARAEAAPPVQEVLALADLRAMVRAERERIQRYQGCFGEGVQQLLVGSGTVKL
jgi:hypothetical protein